LHHVFDLVYLREKPVRDVGANGIGITLDELGRRFPVFLADCDREPQVGCCFFRAAVALRLVNPLLRPGCLQTTCFAGSQLLSLTVAKFPP
jgi:hypothetical protein